MPLFSKRKSDKQKSKVIKNVTNQEGSKNHADILYNVKPSNVSRKSFNAVATIPDIPRKDIFKAGQRSLKASAKCVANFPRRSRLSKSLHEVLLDDSVLPLFLEFLGKQGVQNVLNFWLAAESFRLSFQAKACLPYQSKMKAMRRYDKHAFADSSDAFSSWNSRNTDFSDKMDTKRQVEFHQISMDCLSNESSDLAIQNTHEVTGSVDSQNNSNNTSKIEFNGTDDSKILGSSDFISKERHLNSASHVRGNVDQSQKLGYEGVMCKTKHHHASDDDAALSSASMICDPVSSSFIPPDCLTLLSRNSDHRGEDFFVNSQDCDFISPRVTIEHGINSCESLPQSGTTTTTQTKSFKKENSCSLNMDTVSMSDKVENEHHGRVLSDSFVDEGSDCQSLIECSEVKEHLQRSKTVMMDDALSIYRHFIALDATQSLGMDESTRREVESNICSENGEITSGCFVVAQQFAYSTLKDRYFDNFLRSSYYQKHVMDILTSGNVFLADIMYNDNAMFYFMEFMEQEEKSYLLAFWFAVDSFCQDLRSKLNKDKYNGDEALGDAMVLYEKYFSMQATNSLGVSDETRIRIENKICREGGPLPDCFEEPMENVLTLLEEVYFPLFLESSVYFKYLNEVFSCVTDVENDKTSVCADDCSSTTSDVESAKLMESLGNDVEAPEDPDEIWQRPYFGLSIGRVNEYGVYEPGIEPQPGKEALKFRQKMKKLVSGDSHKVQEEMAWKVARMVLEDVKRTTVKTLR